MVLEVYEYKEWLSVLVENLLVFFFEFCIWVDGSIVFFYIISGVLEFFVVDEVDVDFDGVEIFRNIYEDDLVGF